MPIAPFEIALLPVAPSLLLGKLDRLAGPPVIGVGRLTAIVAGRLIKLTRVIEIAAGIGRLGRRDIGRQRATVAVVHLDKPSLVVGVSVLRVADQVRLGCPLIIVVIAFAARDLFGNAVGAVVGSPHPGARATVFDGVVRRAPRERVVHGGGALDIAVTLASRRRREPRQGRGREGVGGRRRNGVAGRRRRVQRQCPRWQSVGVH